MKLNKYQKQAIVSNIMADVPKIDTEAHRKRIMDGVQKLMTPAVRKVYKETPKALNNCYVPNLHDGVDWGSRVIYIGNVTEEELKPLLAPLDEAVKHRDDTYRKLKGVIESCTTLKKLKELLPEFEQYFPSEAEPTKNLPAVANLVTDMMKLGWPKGAKKGGAK